MEIKKSQFHNAETAPVPVPFFPSGAVLDVYKALNDLLDNGVISVTVHTRSLRFVVKHFRALPDNMLECTVDEGEGTGIKITVSRDLPLMIYVARDAPFTQ